MLRPAGDPVRSVRPGCAYRGGLDAGFSFRGARVPYLSPQKGIFRAGVQRGPAALSIQTSANTPYRDVETPEGFLYDYRAGPIDQADNRALRAAHDLQVPLVYFVGTRPGWYRPNFPFFVVDDRPDARQVLVAPGAMVGPIDELEAILPMRHTSSERSTSVESRL